MYNLYSCTGYSCLYIYIVKRVAEVKLTKVSISVDTLFVLRQL